MSGLTVVVLCLASIAATVLILRPVWALYLQAITLPLQAVFIIQLGANLKISEILGLCTSAGWLVGFVLSPHKLSPPLRRVLLPLGIVLVVIALSLVQTVRYWNVLDETPLTSATGLSTGRQSPHMRSFVTCAWSVYSALMLVAVADLLQNRAAIRRTLMLIFASSSVAAVYAFYKLLFLNLPLPPVWLPGDITTGWARHWAIMRSDGTFMEPATMAGYYVVIVPITLSAWAIERSRLLLLALALEILALVSSFSPGGWATFVVSIVLFVPVLAREANLSMRRVAWVAMGGVIFSVVIGWAAITVGHFDGRVITLNMYQKVTGSDISPDVDLTRANASSRIARVELAKIAIEMWRHNPVLGVGIGNYAFLHPHYARLLGSGYFEGVTVTPSMLYLLILSETGLLGLFAFAFFGLRLLRVFLAAMRRARERQSRWVLLGVTGSLIAIAVNGVVLDNPFANYYWIIGGIGVAAAALSRRDLAAVAREQGTVVLRRPAETPPRRRASLVS